MDLIKTENIFNVNQRLAGTWNGQTHWRVSMTTSAPVVIDYRAIIGLAIQIDLTEAAVEVAITTGAFPAQLSPPGRLGLPRFGGHRERFCVRRFADARDPSRIPG